MKFASKLIHGGPVHLCYGPFEVHRSLCTLCNVLGVLRNVLGVLHNIPDVLHNVLVTVLTECTWLKYSSTSRQNAGKIVFLPYDLDLCPMTLIF